MQAIWSLLRTNRTPDPRHHRCGSAAPRGGDSPRAHRFREVFSLGGYGLFTGCDLKALRAFRLFRLVRSTAMIAGCSNAVAKLARAFSFAKDEAGALFTGTGVIIITVGLGMYHLEHGAQPEVFRSVLDGLWWSVITLTTVGYGDVYPVTAGGKILATVAMFAGIGVIGAACGIMADALREASADEVRE